MQNITINGIQTNFTLTIDQNTAHSTITMSSVCAYDVSFRGPILLTPLGFNDGFSIIDAGMTTSTSDSVVNFNNTTACHV